MEIGSTATQLFGFDNASSIFDAGVSSGPTAEQQSARAIVTAQQREINRIRGYKLQLTPAENFRLGEIQNDILKIQEKASNGTVRADELEDRKELYKEADRIIGKPVLDIDTENDKALTGFVTALETLTLPRLDPVTQRRVDSLKRIKTGVEDSIANNPDSVTLRRRLQSISRTINQLQPLRRVEELSNQERTLYDDIVAKMNDYTGVKLQLSSRDAIRVTQLERSIQEMSANLPADPASQPTSGAVARAYTRFA